MGVGEGGTLTSGPRSLLWPLVPGPFQGRREYPSLWSQVPSPASGPRSVPGEGGAPFSGPRSSSWGHPSQVLGQGYPSQTGPGLGEGRGGYPSQVLRQWYPSCPNCPCPPASTRTGCCPLPPGTAQDMDRICSGR